MRIITIGYLTTIVIALSLMLISCSTTSKPVFTKEELEEGIVILPSEIDPDTDRPMFNVIFPDGKALENMYAEEIANSLATGKWEYNDMLTLTTEK